MIQIKMERILIIINPASNRGKNRNIIPKITTFFTDQHITYQVAQTFRPGEAEKIARDGSIKGFDLIIAAGGDGTVNEVANGILASTISGNKQLPLGVLPIGQGNDFAFGAGIPLDLNQSLENIIKEQIKSIDVGFVAGGYYPKGRYFVNGLGIGFDASVTFEAVKRQRISGFIAYFISAVRTLFSNYHIPKVRAEFDEDIVEYWCLLCSIMNGRRMGGGFYMAPLADISDGILDICLLNKISRIEMVFSALPRFLLGTQESMKAVQNLQSTSFSVKSQIGYLPVHIDGEIFSYNGDFIQGKIIPGALHLVV